MNTLQFKDRQQYKHYLEGRKGLISSLCNNLAKAAVEAKLVSGPLAQTLAIELSVFLSADLRDELQMLDNLTYHEALETDLGNKFRQQVALEGLEDLDAPIDLDSEEAGKGEEIRP